MATPENPFAHAPLPHPDAPQPIPPVTRDPSATKSSDTIAAAATPPGTSALALIRISGPACPELAQAIFKRSPDQLAGAARKAVFGRYRSTRNGGRILDEVLWIYAPGPGTATGEDTLEISCHGNPLIVQLILEDLFIRGCRPAEPGEFTRRAFLNGRLDLTQAEGVIELIHARSERALEAARRQLAGELGRNIERLIEKLLEVLARIEVYIDFPEEDLPPEDRSRVRDDLEFVLRGTSRLLATERYGDLLRDGIKTVLLGAPNAGKSSLLNALVGRERALVSAEPGTTRDFIEEPLQAGPHLLRLIDTAGLNERPGEIERMGIAKTREKLAEADLVLWVVDNSLPYPATPLPPEFVELANPKKTLKIFNKIDLRKSESDTEVMIGDRGIGSDGYRTLAISARTGAGLDALLAAITKLADGLKPEAAAEEQVAVNARHADALRRAEESLAAAKAGIETTPAKPIELISGDVRAALDALGEIAGRVDNERMLDTLFATFCIGK